ncbi:MAG: hypothetical protein K5982_05565 [Selenomonadaceae bacterium]|nr:hypothetical protein [Selenomonadaceae bacterium]
MDIVSAVLLNGLLLKNATKCRRMFHATAFLFVSALE